MDAADLTLQLNKYIPHVVGMPSQAWVHTGLRSSLFASALDGRAVCIYDNSFQKALEVVRVRVVWDVTISCLDSDDRAGAPALALFGAARDTGNGAKMQRLLLLS